MGPARRRGAALWSAVLLAACRGSAAHQAQGWGAAAPSPPSDRHAWLTAALVGGGPELGAPGSVRERRQSRKAFYEEAAAWPQANLKAIATGRQQVAQGPQDIYENTWVMAAGQQHERQPVGFRVWFVLLFAAGLAANLACWRWMAGPEDKSASDLAPAGPPDEAAAERAAAPPPAAGPAAGAPSELGMSILVAGAWMVVSVALVLFNKWLFTDGGFPYPLTLAALHMASCFVVFSIVSCLPVRFRKCVMPDVDRHISWGTYLHGFLPIAILYGIGVGFGDLGFLFASVSFNLFIKPANIVWTTAAAFAFNLEVRTSTHVFIVLLVSAGVALAAGSDLDFSLTGLLCQLTATASEGIRLVLIQHLCQCGSKLDPVTMLYRFSPLTGLLLCGLSFAFEDPLDWGGLASPGLLALNCAIAVVPGDPAAGAAGSPTPPAAPCGEGGGRELAGPRGLRHLWDPWACGACQAGRWCPGDHWEDLR
ncbi:unnamed protein product, partial [Prorocentrum cordatum]